MLKNIMTLFQTFKINIPTPVMAGVRTPISNSMLVVYSG
jgi:hypothetical protein